MTQNEFLEQELLRLAQEDKEAYFVYVDGMGLTLKEVKKVYPERLIACGISEANSHSVAAGLALQGKRVYLINFGPYSYSRTFEHLKMDIAYNNANVKVFSVRTGFKTLVGAGYSHYAIDDISIVRGLPNLKILSLATKKDISNCIDYIKNQEGCAYIRIENIFSEFDSEKNNPKMENYSLLNGKDVIIFATGSMVEYANQLANPLKYSGINVQIINCVCLKPFDDKFVKKAIKKQIPIVVMEEQVCGGLSSIISEIIAKYGKKVKFLPIRIESENFSITGSYEYIANELMGLKNVPNKIIKLVNKKISILGFPLIKFSGKINPNLFTGRCSYRLFGFIPLLRVKQRRHNSNKKKLNFKLYLFDFIRIL